ncbi:MAG: LysE family translocator [Bacteroidota bacterium]
MEYEVLFGFVSATAVLAVFPGPDNIFVLTLSMAHGRRFGLAVVAGLMTGCLIHTTLLAFGLSEVLKRSTGLFWVIKGFGALYLIYLAIIVYRAKGQIELASNKNALENPWRLFKRGFWMNVLNPKVAIFFLAFFPGFLFSDSLNTVIQFYVLGGIFIIVSSFIFGAIAIAAGSISDYILKTPQLGPFLKWIQIVVFLGIAVFLLLN